MQILNFVHKNEKIKIKLTTPGDMKRHQKVSNIPSLLFNLQPEMKLSYVSMVHAGVISLLNLLMEDNRRQETGYLAL